MAVKYQGGQAVPAQKEDFAQFKAEFDRVQVIIAKVNSELYELQSIIGSTLPVRSNTMAQLRRLNVSDLRKRLSDIASMASREAKQ